MVLDKKMMLAGVGIFVLGGVSSFCVMSMMNHGFDGDSRGQYGMNAREGRGMMGEGSRDQNRNSTNQQNTTAEHSMGDGMGMMGDNTMGSMMVSSEKDFLEGMIPHHEEAISTANEVLARGGSTAEIKTLAENIVKAQTVEVASMKAWYKAWYGKEYVANGKYQAMMQPMASLSGAELDKVFLSGMIKHHMGAIMMAKSVQSHIEHDEIKTLSTNIVTTQSAEITMMQSMLAGLK